MRVFQFSRTFHTQQKLKNQPKLCTISWPLFGIGIGTRIRIGEMWQSSGQLDNLSGGLKGVGVQCGLGERANINHGMPGALFELQLESGLPLVSGSGSALAF